MMHGLPLFIPGLENWGGTLLVTLLVPLVYLLGAFIVYFVIYEAVYSGVRRAVVEAWREMGQPSVNVPPPSG